MKSGLALVAALFVILAAFGPHWVFQIVGMCGLVALMGVCLATVRDLERTGWYELRPAKVPALPFQIAAGPLYLSNSVITFDERGVTYQWLLKRRFVAYAEIGRVEVALENLVFDGLKISPIDGHTGDAVWMGGSSDGDTARLALAVLRERAPHAQFSVAPWFEAGWTPYLGFSMPDRGE